MPLEKSGSKRALKRNFHDLRSGRTYARTKKRYGRKCANQQMAAIALSNQRKYRRS